MEVQIRPQRKFFVSVRVRPLNEKEALRNEDVDWECINGKSIIQKNNDFGPDRSMRPSSYSFDRVFGPNCSTRQVYQEGAKAIALSVVDGINASVFAYGQTSSGKTYTMTGIIEYATADIFDHIHKHNERKFHLKFSAMEIYNESVRDLLSRDATPLRLIDDPERGTIVDKLTEEVVRDRNHLAELLSVCRARRQIGEILLNESSSRSHQIIKLTVESYAREVSDKDRLRTLVATVNFVDLAGESESQALLVGSRLKEGSHINHSLLALGTVIRKLRKGRNRYIPYSDSKLTRILQSSLGGNTRTAIICTISPAGCYVEQSRNTLLFATFAKQVTASANVNPEVSDNALAKHLQRKLSKAKNELSNAESSLGTDSASLVKERNLLIHKLERQVRELTLKRDLTVSHIQDVQLEEPGNLPYPKLHIRQESWVSQTSQASAVADHHSIDSDSLTLESSHPSSRGNCCDGSSSSDFDDDFLPRITAELESYEISYDDSSRVFVQTSRGQADEPGKESGIKVRCIEYEESIMSDVESTPMQDERENGKIFPFNVDAKIEMQDHEMTCSGSLHLLHPEADTVETQLDQNRCSLESHQDSTEKIKYVHTTCFVRETQAPDANVVTKELVLDGDSHIADIKEATDVQCTKEKFNTCVKNTKDVGFQYDLDTKQLPSDFDRLKREVIDLWDACNVPLLYRTSFFLLFAGDPEDSIYMEVERRRLSFVKGAFAWGNETVLDGQIISPSLSKKHMQQERQMLSKMMSRRISKYKREILYLKWGIHLDTKERRSQLIRQLWTKPKDMDHIQESARVISMLIKFDKSRIRKEMFGLNLMPALKGVGYQHQQWLHSASVRF